MARYIIIVPHHPNYVYGSKFEWDCEEKVSLPNEQLTVLRSDRSDVPALVSHVERLIAEGISILLAFHDSDPRNLPEKNVDFVSPAALQPLIDSGRVLVGTYSSADDEERILHLCQRPREEKREEWVAAFEDFWCNKRRAARRMQTRQDAYDSRFEELLAKKG